MSRRNDVERIPAVWSAALATQARGARAGRRPSGRALRRHGRDRLADLRRSRRRSALAHGDGSADQPAQRRGRDALHVRSRRQRAVVAGAQRLDPQGDAGAGRSRASPGTSFATARQCCWATPTTTAASTPTSIAARGSRRGRSSPLRSSTWAAGCAASAGARPPDRRIHRRRSRAGRGHRPADRRGDGQRAVARGAQEEPRDS